MGKAKGNKPVQRDEGGRIVSGSGSLNPGGVSRAALEARKLATERVQDWINRLDALTESKDEMVAVLALKTAIPRALGKEGSLSELPDELQLPAAPTDISPAALLSRTMRVYERMLARAEAKLSAGAPMADAEISAIREQVQSLVALVREERELAKSAPGADLTDEALVAKVLGAVPREKLEAALKARSA